VYSNESEATIQCKYKKEQISQSGIEKEIISEANKALNEELPIKHFIYATTLPHNKKLQIFTKNLRSSYPFVISYLGWDEIKKRVLGYPNVFNRYFGIRNSQIDLVSINVDEENCYWKEEKEYVFL
jgi:aspartyl/asparaginyl beta-hydroxylase (cupin superfamily)